MVLKNPYKLITQNSLVNVSSACAKNLYCYWMYYSFFFCKPENFNFFSFIFISWRLITLQYCSGFCHTLTCIIL